MQKEIKFGIMCRGMTLCKWQADAIEKILRIEDIKLSLIVIENKEQIKKSKRILKKILNVKNFLWIGYENTRKYKAAKPIDCSEIFTGVEKMNCAIDLKGKFSQYFKNEDVNFIKSKNLDFILKFGFGIIRGEILNAAQFGIWSFHHDDEEVYRGGPPCFWEIYNGDKRTGAILQKLTDKLDGGVVLKKGYLRTIYSYTRNRDQICFETSNWPAQMCKDLQNKNLDIFNSSPSKTKAHIYSAPNNRQFIKYFFKSNYFLLKKMIKEYLFVDYWNIGVVKAPIQDFLKEKKPDVEWFPLKSKKYFIADSFAITDKENEDKLHIFVETYPYKSKKGIIQYISYEKEVGFSEPTTVIEKKTHLSYPYIIKDEDDIYILPESGGENKVKLYKATCFPLKWGDECVLKDNYAGVDNTIIKRDGTYWMFSSDGGDGSSSYKLNLFYSDKLKSKQWEAHPQNPIKIDIGSSRSAGTPFEHNDELYRPSMDYSEKIEGRIIINKVIKLTKKEYLEEKFSIITPYKWSKFKDKIHTICKAGNYTIVDGAKEAFIFSNINFLKAKLSSIF